jgi:hypothetical protein
MNQRFQKYYETLCLRPGDGWQRLRSAYQSAVSIWHPDRYPDNHALKREAEEKTKALNRAYGELAEYYRTHGALPLDRPTATPTAEPTLRPEPSYTAPAERTSAPAAHPRTSGTRQFPRLVPWALFAAGLAGIVTFWQVPFGPHPPVPVPVPTNPESAPDKAAPSADPAAKPENRFFTVGSSLGEVYSIQGVPSKTENDVWHYGEARVYFANGHVAKWDDPSGRLLKAQTSMEPRHRPHTGFGRGSTKAEVRDLQGSPPFETEHVWEYGPSRVYFKNNRVSGWHESPLHPLKLRR